MSKTPKLNSTLRTSTAPAPTPETKNGHLLDDPEIQIARVKKVEEPTVSQVRPFADEVEAFLDASVEEIRARRAANDNQKPKVEILPPPWGEGEVRELRTAKEIAAYYYRSVKKFRKVYRECDAGRLPHWREGANTICCNTAVVDLCKQLGQVYSVRRKRFTAEEHVKFLGLFDLAIRGIRPTQEEIIAALVKAGVIRIVVR
jgi:hypothetical protein